MGKWKQYKRAELPNTNVLRGMSEASLEILGYRRPTVAENLQTHWAVDAAQCAIENFLNVTGGNTAGTK